jgi:hypothetical protein
LAAVAGRRCRPRRPGHENARLAYAALLEAARQLADGPVLELDQENENMAHVVDLSSLPVQDQWQARQLLKGLPGVFHDPGQRPLSQLAVDLPVGFDFNEFLPSDMATVRVHRLVELPPHLVQAYRPGAQPSPPPVGQQVG